MAELTKTFVVLFFSNKVDEFGKVSKIDGIGEIDKTGFGPDDEVDRVDLQANWTQDLV